MVSAVNKLLYRSLHQLQLGSPADRDPDQDLPVDDLQRFLSLALHIHIKCFNRKSNL